MRKEDISIERQLVLLTAVEGYMLDYIDNIIQLCCCHLIQGSLPHDMDSQFERFKYAVESKEPSKWQFDFFTRLFNVNRILSIDKSKAEGMNRFLDAKFG